MDTTGGDLSNEPIFSSPLPAAYAYPGPGELLYTSPHNLPVATSGDPTAPDILFSLISVRGLLLDPDGAAAIWPAFALLKGAARAVKPARLRMALSALVSEARLVFGACFLIAHASPAPVPH